MLNFCFDRMSSPGVLGYPNLAPDNLGPDEFDHTWPRCTPCRLFVYLKRHGIKVNQLHINDAPGDSWYPISLSWHDFNCDYFSLCAPLVLNRLKNRSLRILFYYHEGDNPFEIKKRMDYLVAKHELPGDCYLFISANTRASEIKNFYYFPDHEYFFHYINRRQSPATISTSHRAFQFTALSRSHKWWRAAIMADLVSSKILEKSLWSYNTNIDVGDLAHENPLEIYCVKGWPEKINSFLENGPYFCGSSDDVSHNDHRTVEEHLYTSSYCNLVLETHFDADGSQGSFITEKTYKCFKFAQPFVMIGPPKSLAMLREHGYRVFDQFIDNRYDDIIDNTQRWFAVKKSILELSKKDLAQWFQDCIPDLEHNQKLFMSGNPENLNSLINHLNKTSC